MLLNFTKSLVRAFSSFRWECAQHFDFLVPKYLSLFKIFDLKHVLLKLHINVWSFDGFFYPFVGTLHPFMVEVFFFLLWSRSLYPFAVNNLGGFECMPGFDRNIAHFIFDMSWVILFGCYFVKIYMLFFDCEIDGAFSFKQNTI